MSTAVTAVASDESLADLLQALGDIPLSRIRRYPPPGTATEADVIRILDKENRIYELVDGVLVEKAMGYYQSLLAMLVGHYMTSFLEKHDLGIVTGADGTIKLTTGLVRIPDVSFFSWRHFPNRLLPAEPIPHLIPDLAVEILSESNTEKEMARKYREYFDAGVKVVWEIDPDEKAARVYPAVDRFTTVTIKQSLRGGRILPGFELPLRKLFARAGERGGRTR